MDAVRMQILMNAAQRVHDAPHGQRGAVVQQAAQALNLSLPRTHTLITQVAQQMGLAKGRKRRADAGHSAITEAELDLIAGVLYHDRRHGKNMITVEEAVNMLYDAGKLATRLSASHVARLLRQRGLDVKSLAAPSAHVRMRVEHINAAWQMDASRCVLYKTPKGELLLLQEGVHYKNKPEHLLAVMDKVLTRFVCVDVASHAIAVRFYIGGESAENALDFLMWCMTQRHDAQGRAMPLHGVPFLLYNDQGMLKDAASRNFCSAMGIRQQWHEAGNARATGSVEVAQNIVERGLESRLRYLDPATITMARLNALGELWMHGYNGAHRHGRHGMTRYAAWSTITSQHLREAPPMEVMRELPVSLAQTRTVNGDRRVSFALKGQGSQDYDLRYVPGVSEGGKVLVAVNPFAAPAVRVGVTDRETGEIVWHEVQPVQTGWMGYDTTAPVLGKDEYKPLPASPADERRQRIAAQAFGKNGQAATPAQVKDAIRVKAAPYQGQFDPFADLKAKAAALPAFLQRPGVPHAPAATSVQPERMSVAAACQRMKTELGALYDSNTYAWLSGKHGDNGVPRDVVEGLIAARQQAGAAAADAPPAPLRVVGGH